MRRRASAIAIAAILAVWAAPAVAAPDRGAGGQAHGAAHGGSHGAAAGDPRGGAQDSASGADEGAGSDSSTGTVNPLAVRNPFCDERLDAAEQRNCRITGTPEGRYPTSNYGFDIHIDTGLDNIVGNFQALLAQIANAIWQAALFVLNLVITLLGWAFGLTPFSDNETMREVDRGLHGFYSAFTEPWLVFAMVAIGAWGLWRGLVRREVSASIAGTLLSLALMIGALWILNEPRATVGAVSEFANDAALSVLAAPQGGVSEPKANYAEATAEVWNEITIPGFAALNFSDADWALDPPDPELLETANESVCIDAAYLAQLPPKRWAELQEAGGEVNCKDLAATLPAPRTNAELYLRSSPGSPARKALWDEHTDDAPYASYFAIQGDGGAWTRLPLVVVIALGLLGGICLLSWLALRLLVQTAVAFVLVLMAPLALFMPAFGERGRAAFALWGGTLAGALIAKLVYAALLAVVLFATTVIASLVDDVGAMVAFLVTAGVWWAVFLKRESLISFLSVSGEGESGSPNWRARMLGLATTASIGRRLAQPLVGAGAGGARAARSGVASHAADRAAASRRVAGETLDRRAERRLDSRLEGERALVADQDGRRERLRSLGAKRAEALREAGRAKAGAQRAPASEERGRHEQARRAALWRAERLGGEQRAIRDQLRSESARETRARSFVADAEDRERRRGRRWSPENVADTREAIRAEADRPTADPAHAWRVGLTPERYRALSGRDREAAHEEVGSQLRHDRAAFGVIPDRPDGLVDPGAKRQLRHEQRRHPEGERALRDARRQIAHRRRTRHRRPDRRGLSR